MQRDDTILLDITTAARQIIAFRGAMTKENFLKDEKTQSAILHQLMIMGEATKRLSSKYARSTCRRALVFDGGDERCINSCLMMLLI